MSQLSTIAGHQCLIVTDDDATIGTQRDATNLIGDSLGEGATVIVVPAAKLDATFFDLRSGLAGDVLQKAANYQRIFAVIGDVSPYTAGSKAFHDLVVESNYSTSYFFVPDMDELSVRLARVAVPTR